MDGDLQLLDSLRQAALDERMSHRALAEYVRYEFLVREVVKQKAAARPANVVDLHEWLRQASIDRARG